MFRRVNLGRACVPIENQYLVSDRLKKNQLTSMSSELEQEPITRSVQLPYIVCETAFSQVRLFLDTPFPRISFQKPTEAVHN